MEELSAFGKKYDYMDDDMFTEAQLDRMKQLKTRASLAMKKFKASGK